jgi:hypothetical protein
LSSGLDLEHKEVYTRKLCLLWKNTSLRAIKSNWWRKGGGNGNKPFKQMPLPLSKSAIMVSNLCRKQEISRPLSRTKEGLGGWWRNFRCGGMGRIKIKAQLFFSRTWNLS